MSRIKHVLAGLAFVAALVAVPAGAQAAAAPTTHSAATATPADGPGCGLCW